MFCPKCRSEYQPGYTKCTDCNITLVSQLPSETNSKYIEYEEILDTYSPSDVALLKSILDAEDIDYLLQGEYVAPYLYYALPVRLLVRKYQVAKVVEVLKDINLSFIAYRSMNSKTEDGND